MPTIALTFVDCTVVLLCGVLAWLLFRKRPTARRPPGPKGWPLIGNVADMPTHHEWLKFSEWGETYGDIVRLDLLGQPMIILGSYKVATDLLDKKSSLYSDRPVLTMCSELVGWKYTLVLTPYGERFREYRRFFHRLIGGKTQIKRFHGLEEHETRKFLARVLRSPEHVDKHIRKTAGAIILKMAYGYEVAEGTDPIVELVDTAVQQFSLASVPGAFLVDVIPALRYVPAWFPGGGFKRLATSWRETLMSMVDVPYQFATSQMKSKTDIFPNFISELLENEKLDPQKEFNIKWAAASLYSGGSDTTVSAIYSFFLAMTLYPEVQRRAQAEIDAVIGNDRLPNFADRDRLPYLEALVKEVFRWNPVAPLGGPHRVMEDDVYDGYLIPKGSIIIANIWKMMHDPTTYLDPMRFNPDRFISNLDDTVIPDPQSMCFGFGRRICPGLQLADASVFISCAMALAVLDISEVVENGVAIKPEVRYTSGTISHPEPFKCSIKARSRKAEALILSVNER